MVGTALVGPERQVVERRLFGDEVHGGLAWDERHHRPVRHLVVRQRVEAPVVTLRLGRQVLVLQDEAPLHTCAPFCQNIRFLNNNKE